MSCQLVLQMEFQRYIIFLVILNFPPIFQRIMFWKIIWNLCCKLQNTTVTFDWAFLDQHSIHEDGSIVIVFRSETENEEPQIIHLYTIYVSFFWFFLQILSIHTFIIIFFSNNIFLVPFTGQICQRLHHQIIRRKKYTNSS